MHKNTLSNTSFKSVPTGHLQILTHLSICLTLFLHYLLLLFYHIGCMPLLSYILYQENKISRIGTRFWLLKLHHMNKYSFWVPGCHHNIKNFNCFGRRVLNCFVITSRFDPDSLCQAVFHLNPSSDLVAHNEHISEGNQYPLKLNWKKKQAKQEICFHFFIKMRAVVNVKLDKGLQRKSRG